MSDANLVAAYKIVKAHEDEEKIYYDLDFTLSPISKIGKEHSEVFYEAEDSSFSIAKSAQLRTRTWNLALDRIHR